MFKTIKENKDHLDAGLDEFPWASDTSTIGLSTTNVPPRGRGAGSPTLSSLEGRLQK